MSGVFPTAVSAVAVIVIIVGMRTSVGRRSSQSDSRLNVNRRVEISSKCRGPASLSPPQKGTQRTMTP